MKILKSYEIFEFWNFIYFFQFSNFQIFWNFWTLNLFWKFWPPTDGISTPLPMVYWTPYPWYIDPPTHGILTPLPMEYRIPYSWYFDPPIHGISTPFPWYIEPLTHGISTPLSMVFWPSPTRRMSTPYTWYFDLPAYLLIRNGGFKIPWGFNLPYRGGSVFNKGVQYTMNVNWPRVQFTMGFKIPYDTGCPTIYSYYTFRIF